MPESHVPTVNIVSSPVSALPFENQIDVIAGWAKQKVSKFVCVANVHMLMEAHWNQDFRAVLEKADLVTPDGMPLVWLMRAFGFKEQDRVAGLDILLAVCRRAESDGQSVFFVGSTEDVLEKIRVRLSEDFPNLKVAGTMSPPFRTLTSAEDEALVREINESGAEIVFVAFGCPKQESWMAQHRDRISAVMVGLGAVFPLYAGLHHRAPLWIRESGLEWLYRLFQEPRRLWKRYGTTIPPFLWLATKQLFNVSSQSVSVRKKKI